MTLDRAHIQQHLADLAQAFQITVIQDPSVRPEEARANPALRMVILAPVTEDTGYATALHEMGHLVSPTGSLRTVATAKNHRLVLDEETSAWEWAQHYALDWTPAMEHLKQWALGTYQAMATEVEVTILRDRLNPVTPKAVQPLREFAGRITWHS